tara:strand:- start:239 stop:517 length:279 start_codon:yes stop_codon:yes gene_type:complete
MSGHLDGRVALAMDGAGGIKAVAARLFGKQGAAQRMCLASGANVETEVTTMSPMRHLGAPDNVTLAERDLLSDESGNVAGSSLNVDGGRNVA